VKLLFRIISVILFVIFFGFALKNTQETTLFFFWGYELRGPLVLLLLGFFVAGGVFGVLAMTPMVFRHRRELSRHRKALESMRRENEAQQMARIQPPPPDTVAT
jgi:uncharacterized integral membrane protein